jgi:hypothetical protein
MPAKAGIQSLAGIASARLDTGFRRYDESHGGLLPEIGEEPLFPWLFLPGLAI